MSKYGFFLNEKLMYVALDKQNTYVIKLKTLWKFVEAWFILFFYLKDMPIKSVTLLTLVILIS
jgi:hypothetical protein